MSYKIVDQFLTYENQYVVYPDEETVKKYIKNAIEQIDTYKKLDFVKLYINYESDQAYVKNYIYNCDKNNNSPLMLITSPVSSKLKTKLDKKLCYFDNKGNPCDYDYDNDHKPSRSQAHSHAQSHAHAHAQSHSRSHAHTQSHSRSQQAHQEDQQGGFLQEHTYIKQDVRKFLQDQNNKMTILNMIPSNDLVDIIKDNVYNDKSLELITGYIQGIKPVFDNLIKKNDSSKIELKKKILLIFLVIADRLIKISNHYNDEQYIQFFTKLVELTFPILEKYIIN
jgi:hypothetical protein